MNRIRVGFFGTLHDHAGDTMECLRKLSDLFEVVGYVPESAERYEAVKDSPFYAGIPAMSKEELLGKELDAAVVETGELQLIPTALCCVKRGLPVHIDKPAGDDLAAFSALLNLAAQNKLAVQMGYMYRYNPAVQEALRIVKSGALGRVYSVEAHMNCLHPAEKRQWLGQFPGGMTFFLGCHLVDLILQFQGMPERVIPFNTCIGADGVTARDLGMAVFEYKNGVSFLKASALEANGFSRRQLVISGTQGTIEIKPLEAIIEGGARTLRGCGMSVCYNGDAVDWSDRKTPVAFAPFDRYEGMMRHFAALVRGEENLCSYDYEYSLQKVILEACR